MMLDRYNLTPGEIFQKSKCLEQEGAIIKQVDNILLDKGYTVDSTGQSWQKDNQKVVVSFVDDFSRHSEFKKLRGENSKEKWFDQNTVVITDNHILFDPVFGYEKAPDTFFGIYSYLPEKQTWAPERDFHFSVNRIDRNRTLMFLELLKFYGTEELLTRTYMNFNGYNPSSFNYTSNDIKNNFQWTFQKYQAEFIYDDYDFDFILHAKSIMPVRNHPYSIEEADHKTWMNVVMETYIGENVIALSEKIFRALSTPVPWVCLCGRGTMDYLESLGFDTMSDVVDHAYNHWFVNIPTTEAPAKFRELIEHIDSTVASLKQRPFKSLQTRAKKAADNNVKLLAKMKKSFYSELDSWLQQVSKIC